MLDKERCLCAVARSIERCIPTALGMSRAGECTGRNGTSGRRTPDYKCARSFQMRLRTNRLVASVRRILKPM
jgi:hypothetical protein